jgi:rhodanese-related sulfurtransferase
MTQSLDGAIAQIRVDELADRIAAVPNLQLVDVREPHEVEIASLAGFKNLPLSQSNAWAEQIHSLLDADQETLVLCHHGMRSTQMCQWLMSQGFTNVKNITGGIDAYSTAIDRSVPRY